VDQLFPSRPPTLTSTLYSASIGLSSIPGNSNSRKISFSDDGRYVAFESTASNLVSGDTNGLSDIFVRDTTTGTTVRASVSTAGTQANAQSMAPVISGNGRYVAFVSLANNLVSGDTNAAPDIFVRDLQANTTIRVSVGASGTQANAWSDTPSISDDGRYVGFRSAATNLVSGDTNGDLDFFVFDIVGATTTRVSISTAGTQGDDDVVDGAVSGNGSFFVFSSNATNMVSGDTNGCTDVFVRDLSAGTTELISKSTSGSQGNRASSSVDISSDGRYVVFDSRASNLASNSWNKYTNVYLRDRTSSTTELISIANDGVVPRFDTRNPKVSNDGRFVVFESYSPDFNSGDTNNDFDSFMRDRSSGLTTVISADASGVFGNKTSRDANISGDGSTIGFISFASNLVSGDTNMSLDAIYRVNQLPSAQIVNITPENPLPEAGGTINGFRITRTGSTTTSLVVNYTVSGTATPGTDYTALSGAATIAAGQSYVLIPVAVIDDTIVEGNEPIILTLSASASYIIGGLSTATNPIIDDDLFVVSIVATNNIATEDGGQTGLFTISRTGGTTGDLVVNLTVGGTATLGTDYAGFSTPVIIPNGQTSTTQTIYGIPDGLYDGDESIIVTVASGGGYSIGTSNAATVTLKDSNTQTISVTTISSIADQSDTSRKGTYRISRDGSTVAALTFSYVMTGTATNGVDYITLSGSATIPSSQSYVDIDVTGVPVGTNGTILTARMELIDGPLYRVGLSRSAVVLVLTPNALPVVQVVATDPTATEDGTHSGIFTISRSGSTSAALVVYFTYGGTATYGADYTTSAPSAVSIPSGASSATITITGVQDTLVEGTELVTLALSSRSTYIVDDVLSKANVAILDDDQPSISVRTTSPRAYESGSKDGEILISRLGDLSSNLTVNYTVSGTATSGTDFTSIGTSIVIPAGASQVSIPIHAISDSIIEGPENVILTVAASGPYSISAYSQGRVDIVGKTYSVMNDILHIAPNADLHDVSLSSDGRYLVFSSTASNLVSGDNNGLSDIFVADLVSGTISRIMGVGGVEPNGSSRECRISADGNFVVFSTDATNMFDNDSNGNRDIVLYYRPTGTRQNVSGGPGGLSFGGDSMQPSISTNGNFVAFSSYATNLVAGDTNGKADIFIFKRADGSTTRASYTASHGQFTNDSFKPSVSDDGNIVGFETKESVQSDSDSFFDVVAVNMASGTFTRVSKPLVGTVNDGDSSDAKVSANGVKVVFTSLARDLVPNDVNNSSDIFIMDMNSTNVARASSTSSGAGADMASRSPSVSSEGRYTSFISSSRNLADQFNCTTTAVIKDNLTGLVSPIDYQTGLDCKAPLLESVLTPDGRFVVSSVASDVGVRDVLISSNPLWR
jgi:hypothetical protein